jgi:5'-nucleotidase
MNVAKSVKNRKAVTCEAVKRNGERCKQTRGLVDGLCASHRVAQPAGGVDEFKSILEEVINNTPADGTTKFDLVNGIPTEIPVDVAGDVIQKSEELAQSELAVVSSKYDYVQAAAIIDQYQPLLKYISESAVKDTRELADILVSVVRLTMEETENEWMKTTDVINKLSMKVKHMREDAKNEYGKIPLDIRMDIAALDEEIFQLKNFKAILQASLELHEEAISQEEEEDKQHEEFETRMSRHNGFFKKLKKFFPSMIIAIGAILILLATMAGGDKQPSKEHKANPTPVTVVDEKPVGEHVPADFAGLEKDKYSNPVPAAPVASVNVVVHDGDTLWDIAVKVYGDGTQWTKIYDSNHNTLNADDARNVQQPGHWIHAGQVLHVDLTDSLNDH